ncbi:MAG: endonuclease [Rhodospirillales bacterium]|jgi:5-methylcytosine-specific restriction protein A|nr:endonuclease [Rhodospirillales bacterium]
MPWQPPVHRPPGWQDKRARDRDYGIHRDKRSLKLMQSGEWRSARKAFLARHRFCIECGEPATVVDHRDPHKGEAAVFWDRSRWQPMCASCHGRKTAVHDGGSGMQGAEGEGGLEPAPNWTEQPVMGFPHPQPK